MELTTRVPVIFTGPLTFRVVTLRLFMVVGQVTVRVVTFNKPITALVAFSVPKVEFEVTNNGPTILVIPDTARDVALRPV